MTLRPSLPLLLLMLAVALGATFVAAGSFKRVESALAAAVFAIFISVAAIRTNAPLWREASTDKAPREIAQREALATNALLIALAFLWCGLAFYAVYLGTSVRWQHGWEYGSACILFALLYGYTALRLSDSRSAFSQQLAMDRVVRIAGYQALLIAIGLIWLIGAGKLVTHKGDWAANQLFLGGGFAIMCISVILIKTHAALAERQTAAN
jgi:hypothetical protein